MKAYLFCDFGSTNTKLTLVDIDKEEIAATSRSYTTIETDVMVGFHKAYDQLMDQVDEEVEVVKATACSSAAGGLKMVSIGLVESLTAEAAKRAALGAGAKVIKTYAGELNNHEVQEIKDTNLDIILLAGGTDGGNTECIIHNAKKLAEAGIDVPIVVAGNKSALDDVEAILQDGGVEYYVAENVMPKVNQINVESSRELIRKVFMGHITQAKGMGNVKKEISDIIMPTPAAVLKAAELLSKGSENEEGVGDLAVLDIGGATTDVHSLATGDPTNAQALLRGLQEPYAKRTVEGDLGMRYSISSVVENAQPGMLKDFLGDEYDYDIDEEVEFRKENTDYIADNDRALNFDLAMAKVCAKLSMFRHVGRITSTYNPILGELYEQVGKDLTDLKIVIGTGGVLAFSQHAKEILEAVVYDPLYASTLAPKEPDFYLDASYTLSAMGLLAMIDPDMAVRMMKKSIVKLED